jgi:hypothetical protein
MGTEAPRWWRQLLDQLQVAAAEASAAADGGAADIGWQPHNLHAICDTIGNLEHLPDKLPKAVWKKVLALQVLDLARDNRELSYLLAWLAAAKSNTKLAMQLTQCLGV